MDGNNRNSGKGLVSFRNFDIFRYFRVITVMYVRSGKIGFFLNTWNWLFFWPPNLGLLGFSPFFFAAQQTVSNIAYMDSILTVEHCPNELIIAAKEYH